MVLALKRNSSSQEGARNNLFLKRGKAFLRSRKFT